MLDHPDAPWQPPEQLPPTADLRRGVAILEQQLAPADYDHVLFCVGKLLVGFNERMTKDEGKVRARSWHETLSDLPRDLWSAGTMDLLRSWERDKHFGRVPEASDLLAAVRGRLDRRRQDLDRARLMLATANQADLPSASERQGPIRVPEKVRLRRILEEQRTKPYAAEDHRFHDMAHTERALAFAEERSMAAWAREFFDARIAGAEERESLGHHAKQLATRNSPAGRRMAELAAAHRDGRPPAEHRDVAEASHG